MDHADKPKFLATLTACAEYYGKELSEPIIGLYWEGLRHLGADVFDQAMAAHMRNPEGGQFMPRIADLINLTSGNNRDAAMLAWSKIDSAVRLYGPYPDVVFDDPIIHRVIEDMGGWILLNGRDDKSWPFVQNEFMTRYRGYGLRENIGRYLPVLTGITNAANRPGGFADTPPLLLGNPGQANAVLLGGDRQPRLLATQARDCVPLKLTIVDRKREDA